MQYECSNWHGMHFHLMIFLNKNKVWEDRLSLCTSDDFFCVCSSCLTLTALIALHLIIQCTKLGPFATLWPSRHLQSVQSPAAVCFGLGMTSSCFLFHWQQGSSGTVAVQRESPLNSVYSLVFYPFSRWMCFETSALPISGQCARNTLSRYMLFGVIIKQTTVHLIKWSNRPTNQLRNQSIQPTM